MHWADKIAKEIIDSKKYKPYWVDDMKTPSGFAHIGSMLGPVIHSAIYRALKDAGQDVTFTFVINDFDHADDMPSSLKDEYGKYLGMSLKMIPSPVSEHKCMADYFAADFVNSIRSLGVEARIISSWDLYHQGKFDELIKIALDSSEKIQDIYQEVSGSAKKEKGWLPFQVICEKCKKIGTTRVYAWDGKEVSYKCEPNMVTWAQGCGHEGKMSPFGGNGKLPWKVDWSAHWKVIGVTIEGAGKDHASAGGSYDIAMRICKEVFGYPEPYKLPYEFVLIGGKKMSSSKGIGLKAHDLVKILPAEVARFLFINADIGSQSNFDPNRTMAIPDLFDAYDAAWKEQSRSFVLSQIKGVSEKYSFAPRFRDIANYLSQGLSEGEILEKFSEAKPELLQERIKYARVWLENYAPEEYRFEMTEEIPEAAKNLSNEQKEYLKEVVKLVEKNINADYLQTALYELSKQQKIKTSEAFAAIYLAFIGKTHGPRAGLLLTNFGKKKITDRIASIMNGGDING